MEAQWRILHELGVVQVGDLAASLYQSKFCKKVVISVDCASYLVLKRLGKRSPIGRGLKKAQTCPKTEQRINKSLGVTRSLMELDTCIHHSYQKVQGFLFKRHPLDIFIVTVRHRRSKTYIKCGLTNWTHGPATNIQANDPACEKWSVSGTGED